MRHTAAWDMSIGDDCQCSVAGRTWENEIIPPTAGVFVLSAEQERVSAPEYAATLSAHGGQVSATRWLNHDLNRFKPFWQKQVSARLFTKNTLSVAI